MNQFRSPLFLLILGGLCVVGAFAWQQRSIHQLRNELALTQAAPPAVVEEAPSATPERSPEPVVTARPDTAVEVLTNPHLERRVALLEQSVAQLGEGADHLMDRGRIPPSDDKLFEWSTTFQDLNATPKERLAALRMLRRNDAFTPQLVQAATLWLAASTDPTETRSLLESLRGEDDPALKAATLNLASAATDNRVRDLAIANLREFVEDPQVEALLWQVAASDSSDRVRRRAQDALRRVPMTEARAASLEMRALGPSATLDERLTSLRLLESGQQEVARIAPSLAQLAQTAPDKETRLKYYKAFDDVNDPNFMSPLVEGSQDADAEVRRIATDALMDYRSEPAITELLQAMAESDPDPRVRREAARVFNNGRR